MDTTSKIPRWRIASRDTAVVYAECTRNFVVLRLNEVGGTQQARRIDCDDDDDDVAADVITPSADDDGTASNCALLSVTMFEK